MSLGNKKLVNRTRRNFQGGGRSRTRKQTNKRTIPRPGMRPPSGAGPGVHDHAWSGAVKPVTGAGWTGMHAGINPPGFDNAFHAHLVTEGAHNEGTSGQHGHRTSGARDEFGNTLPAGHSVPAHSHTQGISGGSTHTSHPQSPHGHELFSKYPHPQMGQSQTHDHNLGIDFYGNMNPNWTDTGMHHEHDTGSTVCNDMLGPTLFGTPTDAELNQYCCVFNCGGSWCANYTCGSQRGGRVRRIKRKMRRGGPMGNPPINKRR